MADDGERRMLFDLRGRRRNVIRGIYAILAVLMGASLFLVAGSVNIGELIGNGGSTSSSEIFEEQAERIEQRLVKDPNDPQALVALTRARINAGNAKIEVVSEGEVPTIDADARVEFEAALRAWDRYLDAAGDEPSASLAQLVAGTLFRMAESGGSSYAEVEENVAQATEAQRIAAEARPTVGSLSTLAYYEYFNGNFKAGDEAKRRAADRARSKEEVKAVESQLAELRKSAKQFVKQKNQQTKAERELNQVGKGGNPFALPGEEGLSE